MVRFGLWMMIAGVAIFCLSIMGWAGLEIAGNEFAAERVMQAGIGMMCALIFAGVAAMIFPQDLL